MTWGRLDDKLAFHPKTLKAGNAAMGLWVRALSWCIAQLNDGRVPHEIVAALGGSQKDADALVACRLWHETIDGYEFHDWSIWQQTREQVEAKRSETASRVAIWRETRRNTSVTALHESVTALQKSTHSRDDAKTASSKTKSDELEPKTRESTRKNTASSNAVTNALVTLLDTDTEKEKDMHANRVLSRTRGTRLAENFVVDEHLLRYALDKAPAVNVEREIEKFRNYWASATGAKAVKLDWGRALQNWLLSAQQRAEDNGWKPSKSQPKDSQSRLDLWLAARGVTLDEYERRKIETGWLESLREITE
jgi:hypothetical protein